MRKTNDKFQRHCFIVLRGLVPKKSTYIRICYLYCFVFLIFFLIFLDLSTILNENDFSFDITMISRRKRMIPRAERTIHRGERMTPRAERTSPRTERTLSVLTQ